MVDVASISNAVCNSNVSQSFDLIGFGINMIGNIVAGLISGWVVTIYYRKRDLKEIRHQKRIAAAGAAMQISVAVDTALSDNCHSGYQKLKDKISELSSDISYINFEHEKEDDSNKYINSMKAKMAVIVEANSNLTVRLKEKEFEGEFYKINKNYVNECIDSNRTKLENASKELFEIAIDFNEYIQENNK